ncbi:sporulation protein [Kineococcus indalonis]|uniref:sporulation protein n=1 Tax=Kineococcus indalonis TaxID=2696566 RepID=UPI001411E6D4|nr:sporulation protein [Kineococcus indalonis]NAZ85699.1 sporulation protein [Kineococcus indalonis]
MGLRDLAARFGAGAASVDTVLERDVARPGGPVAGRVVVVGGAVAQDVQEVVVALQARVEVESGDSEWREDVVFARARVGGGFTTAPGERAELPFSLLLPWQTPVTAIGGWHLRGVHVGVVTRLVVAGAVDPGDLDALTVAPLPVQQAVVDALGSLGWRFKSADVEKGRVRGSELPFHQELEFAPPRHVRGVNELEVTFLADPHGVDVVLEADRRGGLLTEGRDVVSRLRLSHADTDRARVAGALEAAVRELGSRRGWGW